MAQQIINIGTADNDGTGDPARTAFNKTNQNFTELYAGGAIIANDAVTYAKMQNVSAAALLLGRGSAAGAGDPEEITLGTGLSMTGTVLASTATGGGGFTACGRLTFTSTTALSFAPYNGNQIKINGALQTIPNAGIAGLTNTAAFVNGTGGSSLAANTTYYVYAFMNSSTVTADFSTTGHATSTAAGNEGVEIKSGDNTRSLIGMCRTNASSQFQDSATFLGVLSWFNRRRRGGNNKFSADRSTAANPFVELNSEIRIEFLTWADEAVVGIATGMVANNAIAYVQIGIAFDSTTVPTAAQGSIIVSTGYYNTFALAPVVSMSEGFHYVTLLGGNNASGASTATFNANDTSGAGAYQAACRLYVDVRG